MISWKNISIFIVSTFAFCLWITILKNFTLVNLVIRPQFNDSGLVDGESLRDSDGSRRIQFNGGNSAGDDHDGGDSGGGSGILLLEHATQSLDSMQFMALYNLVRQELKDFLPFENLNISPKMDFTHRQSYEHQPTEGNYGYTAAETPVLRLRGGTGKALKCPCKGACNHPIPEYESGEEDENINPDSWFEDNDFRDLAAVSWDVINQDSNSDSDSYSDSDSESDIDEEEFNKPLRRPLKQIFSTPLRNDAATTSVQENTVQVKKLTKRQQLTNDITLETVVGEMKECCCDDCLKTIPPQTIIKTMKMFWSLDEEGQRGYILNFLQISQRYSKDKVYYDYYVTGRKVCSRAWMQIHGISNGRFYKLKKQFEDHERRTPQGSRVGRIRTSQRWLDAESWFEEFCTGLVDVMPDDDKLHLPSCMTKGMVFKAYQTQILSSTTYKPLSFTHFRRMWKSSFKHVVVRKTNRFTKCGVCTLMDEHMYKTMDKQVRGTWAERKNLHITQQKMQRKKYYLHQRKSVLKPHRYTSRIIDGMDQGKTHLPHWWQITKIEGEFAHFMKTHVTGLLGHGRNIAMCFLDFIRSPQDANPTMNALLTSFRYEKEKFGILPPTLYLQIDNCYRDCKNIYILGFCALLVMAGVFKKVRLSYLMVGHTHEDVDQMFSRVAKSLRITDATTMEALRNVIHNSYTPKPVTVVRENLYDLKAWIAPYICRLQNHSSHHAFRFKKNSNGHIEMTYRNWADAAPKEWEPENPIIFMRQMPEGTPRIIRPDNSKIPKIDEMTKAIKKLESRFTGKDMQWWNKFRDDEIEKRENWESLAEEDYEALGSSFTLEDLRYTSPPESDEEDNIDEETRRRIDALNALLKKENTFREVKVVKQAPGPNVEENKPAKGKKRRMKARKEDKKRNRVAE